MGRAVMAIPAHNSDSKLMPVALTKEEWAYIRNSLRRAEILTDEVLSGRWSRCEIAEDTHRFREALDLLHRGAFTARPKL